MTASWCLMQSITFLNWYYFLTLLGRRRRTSSSPLIISFFLNFQDGGRAIEENGGIATTGKIRRTKRGDGRGRERGRETQVNVKTLITGTKRSTGIAEATTQTQSLLEMALYSSALDRQSLAPPHPPPPVILPFFLLQHIPTLTHCSPPSTPLCRGVAATCMIWICLCTSGMGHIQPQGLGHYGL